MEVINILQTFTTFTNSPKEACNTAEGLLKMLNEKFNQQYNEIL